MNKRVSSIDDDVPARYLPKSDNIARYDRQQKPARFDWVDAAKAVSMLLVVAWHTLNHQMIFNQLLIYVRMPLFFFIAGFFVSKSLSLPYGELLTKRVFHFLYLYILWMVISFSLTQLVAASADGRDPNWSILLTMFHKPAETLWFIYALALVFALAGAFRVLKPAHLALLLMAIYTVSVGNGEWFDLNLADRVVRLALMFFLGAISFPFIARHIGKVSWSWPLLTCAYLAFAYLIKTRGLDWLSPLTLTASLMGIGAILCGAFWVQRLPVVAAPVNFVGMRTIHIYILHRPVLFYWDMIDHHIVPHALKAEARAVAAVVISLLLGAALARIVPWVFESPWNRTQPARANA